MNQTNVRWIQRLDSYRSALGPLKEGVELSRQRSLSNLERQGLIKSFEFTHELAWNLMKDFLEFQGTIGIMGSRDATRESFQKGLIKHGDIWMDMIRSRNLSSHAYNEAMSKSIEDFIENRYTVHFVEFFNTMDELKHVHFP